MANRNTGLCDNRKTVNVPMFGHASSLVVLQWRGGGGGGLDQGGGGGGGGGASSTCTCKHNTDRVPLPVIRL